MRRLAFAAALVALSAATSSARATPNFPAAIQANVGAPAQPPCTICHNNPGGGLGTVTTRFGMYMRSRGLMPFDVGSLQTALAADRAEKHVSNDIGIDDIDALMRGLDPNAPMGASGGEPPPEYGCVGRVAGHAHGTAWNALLIASVAAGFVFVRRSRRRIGRGRND